MHETTPIVPNDNVEEVDKFDVAMNTYDMTTPIKNKVTSKRTSKKPKIITIDFGEDALQREHSDPQIELCKKADSKNKSTFRTQTQSKIYNY